MYALRIKDLPEQDWSKFANPGVAPSVCPSVEDEFLPAPELLDRMIPLDGASHNEVEYYGVEIPMRYATCFAILTDGRKVMLQDSRFFVGWSGWDEKRSYLFRNGGLHIEMQTDAKHPVGRSSPGNVCNINLQTAVTAIEDRKRKFIAPDGSQIEFSGARC